MFPQSEEKLQASKQALNTATSEPSSSSANSILHFSSNTESNSTNCRTSHEYVKSKRLLCSGRVPDREAIRAAIETTTHERNRTQVLLLSFITVSGYEAVEIFNQRSYEGHDDWELRASGVRFHGGDNSDLMTIQEAVDLASLLRRKDHVAQNDASRRILSRQIA